MKTYLAIVGQPQGNKKLRNLIKGSIKSKQLGNNYYLQFPTKKEAKQRLKEAFKLLLNSEYDYYLEGGFQISEHTLYYDASIIKIHKGII